MSEVRSPGHGAPWYARNTKGAGFGRGVPCKRFPEGEWVAMDYEHMQAALRIDCLIRLLEKKKAESDSGASTPLEDYAIKELEEIKAVIEQ